MDDVLRGVWSPKYYNDLEKALKDYYLEEHDEIIGRIVSANKTKANAISMFMRNRAAFLAVITIIIILMAGYEGALADNKNLLLAVENSTLTLSVFSVLALFFNQHAFSSKQHTAISIIAAIILSCIVSFINTFYFQFYLDSEWIVNVILLVLMLPIVWQIFVCWMFSSAYKGYIRQKLIKGKENYELAKRGLQEHNPKIIPRMYLDLYHPASIESDNAEEAKSKCLDNYLELMEEEIAQASNPKSVFKIFVSWLGFRMKSTFITLFRNNKISQKPAQ